MKPKKIPTNTRVYHTGHGLGVVIGHNPTLAHLTDEEVWVTKYHYYRVRFDSGYVDMYYPEELHVVKYLCGAVVEAISHSLRGTDKIEPSHMTAPYFDAISGVDTVVMSEVIKALQVNYSDIITMVYLGDIDMARQQLEEVGVARANQRGLFGDDETCKAMFDRATGGYHATATSVVESGNCMAQFKPAHLK